MPPLIHPVINGMFVVPARLLEGRADLPKLRKQLTAQYYNVQTGERTPVRMYRESEDYFTMPREFGRERFPDLWERALDRTTHPIIKPHTYKKQITPRDEQQEAFFAAIAKRLQDAVFDNVIIDLQINAKTGTGKTVAAIGTTSAAQITPILVIVPRNRIKAQWRGSVEQGKGYKFFFGPEWTDIHVGGVQQDEFLVIGKDVVLAMGPTLISRRFPLWFYNHFGVIVVDELHKFATPMLNQCLGMFSAAVRVGMTATERKGAMKKVVDAHLGEPAIISTQESMKPTVVRIINKMDLPNLGDEHDNQNSIKLLLSRLKIRNELLAQVIYQRGYSKGRRCLILGDRIKQLQWLAARVGQLGVPHNQIGMYVGEYTTDKWKSYGRLRDGVSDSILARMGKGPVFDNKKEAEKYAQSWSLHHWKATKLFGEYEAAGAQPYFEIGAERQKVKPTTEEYDHIENHCQIVFATYGIFEIAIDVSSLDWGLEAGPRGDVEQAVGRTLRIRDGKSDPVWYTVEDEIHTFAPIENFMGETVMQRYIYQTPQRLAKRRMTSYIRQNASFKVVRNPYAALGITQN